MKIRRFLTITACTLPTLLLGACGEYSLAQKEGSEHLMEGQRLYYFGDDRSEVYNKYLKAYASKDSRVKARAAYELSRLADEREDYASALTYMQVAFDHGYRGSKIRLGKAYMDAGHAEKAKAIFLDHQYDIDAVILLAELAAQQNDHSQSTIYAGKASQMYAASSDEDGRNALQIARLYADLPQGKQQALRWYRLAHEKRQPDAATGLARTLIYKKPTSTEAYREGIALLKVKAKEGSPDAMEALARAYSEYNQYDQALHWYRKRQALGDPSGEFAYRIGKIYRKRDHIPRERELMHTWFKTAAARGNRRAANALIRYEEQERRRAVSEQEKLLKEEQKQQKTARKRRFNTDHPELVKGYAMLQQKDRRGETLALRHFRKLADSERLISAMLIADSLKGSSGKSQTYSASFKQADPGLLYDTVKRHQALFGTERPDLITKQWGIAAEYGSGNAAYKLAKHYSHTDPEQAQPWFKKAASLGNGDAMLHMARIYAIDNSDEKSAKKAFYWYEKAAKARIAEGQYHTGLLYAKGQGVDKDTQKARYWLNKAKNNGYALAPGILESIAE